MKFIVIAAAAALVVPGVSLAKGHNPAEARDMAEALATGVNQDAGTKEAVEGLGFEGPNDKAAVPAYVSGGGNGGWGNIGSTLTGTQGKSVSGR